MIWGIIGPAVTVTVRVWVAVAPLEEVAVSVNVVVAVIGTTADPVTSNGPLV